MRDRRLLSPFLRPLFFCIAAVSLSSATLQAQPFDVTGRMMFHSIEGGCWYLSAYDGKQYELWGSKETLETLHKDGSIVDLTVEPVKSAASTCMIGEIVRVLEIKDVRMQPYDPPITPTNIDGIIHRTQKGTWYVRLKNGTRYEFKEPPPKSKRHIGARYQAHVMVLSEARATKEKMDGVILPPPPSPPNGTKKSGQMAPGKQYDPK
jgi:hypothetical protein